MTVIHVYSFGLTTRAIHLGHLIFHSHKTVPQVILDLRAKHEVTESPNAEYFIGISFAQDGVGGCSFWAHHRRFCNEAMAGSPPLKCGILGVWGGRAARPKS